MWFVAAGRPPLKHWLGPLTHTTVNWWNVSVARKCVDWIDFKHAARLKCCFSYWPNVSTLRLGLYLSLHVMSSLNAIMVLSFVTPSAIWKLSFNSKNRPCPSPTLFFLLPFFFGMCPSSVHEDMSCLCFFGSVSGYQGWL